MSESAQVIEDGKCPYCGHEDDHVSYCCHDNGDGTDCDCDPLEAAARERDQLLTRLNAVIEASSIAESARLAAEEQRDDYKARNEAEYYRNQELDEQLTEAGRSLTAAEERERVLRENVSEVTDGLATALEQMGRRLHAENHLVRGGHPRWEICQDMSCVAQRTLIQRSRALTQSPAAGQESGHE